MNVRPIPCHPPCKKTCAEFLWQFKTPRVLLSLSNDILFEGTHYPGDIHHCEEPYVLNSGNNATTNKQLLYIRLATLLTVPLILLSYNFAVILLLYIFCSSKWKDSSSLPKIDGLLQQRQKLCQLSRNLMPSEQKFLPQKSSNNILTNCSFHLCCALPVLFLLFPLQHYLTLWSMKNCEMTSVSWGEVTWDEMVWGENRWDAMQWDELSWDEMRWAAVGWSEINEMRWDRVKWDCGEVKLVETDKAELR